MEELFALEPLVRLTAFAGVLVLMLLWETLAPRRPVVEKRSRHTVRNIAIIVIDTVFARIVVPVVPVAAAMGFAEAGWGLFNVLDVPFWVAVVVSVIVLDFAIYLQHVMFHAVPALWRLHMVHHTDLDFDTTTGVRFHPIEIALSILIKLAVVALLGAPALGVMLFEILLNATSLFNHGNVRLPKKLDRVLRWIVVTPEMHRVHHSAWERETNRNFGFNLPWWDRLLGTYKAQPRDGHEGMTIGLETYRRHEDLTLGKLLLLPFTGRGGAYTMGDDGRREHE